MTRTPEPDFGLTAPDHAVQRAGFPSQLLEPSMPRTAGAAVAESTDKALRAVVKSLERSFNAHDADAFSGHFAEDASWTTVTGHRVHGGRSINEFARKVMPQLREQYARYEVMAMRPISRLVVAVHVMQTPTTATGSPLDIHRASALYIMVNRDGKWQIAASQSTVIGDDLT